MRRNYSKYLWGVMLILLGIFVVLKSFDVVSGSIFFTGWWTLFIIIPSAINLIFNNNRIWDLSVLLFGIALFLAANDLYLEYSNVWAIAVCLVLINIGIGVMRGNKVKTRRQGKIVSGGNYVAIFSGCDEKPVSFDGGNAVAVFGGVDLDLRDLVFTNDVYLTAVSVFGGVDIYTNNNINVVFNTVNIFGGSDNYQPYIEGKPTLYVDGCCVFGGTDVNKKRR